MLNGLRCCSAHVSIPKGLTSIHGLHERDFGLEIICWQRAITDGYTLAAFAMNCLQEIGSTAGKVRIIKAERHLHNLQCPVLQDTTLTKK